MTEPEAGRRGGLRKAKRRTFKDLRRMKQLALLLKPYARFYRGSLALGVLVTALYIGLHLAQPWPLKWVLDTVTGKHQPPPLLAGVGSEGVQIALLSGLYVMFSVMAGLAEYGQNLLLAGVGNRLLARFRLDLFGRVMGQSLAFHERKDLGELLTRVVYDTARLRQGVRNILTRSIQTILLFVSKVVVLLLIDVRLAAILGLAGLAALVAMRKPSARIFSAARKQRRSEGRLASVVGESLAGIREFQTFSPGLTSDERFRKQNARSLKGEQKVRRLAAALLFRTEVILSVSICLILWIGGRAIQAGTLTAGDLVLFFSYATGLFDPFRSFARQSATTGRTLACGDRLMKIMDKEPVVKDLPEAVEAGPLKGEVVFEDVVYRNPHRDRAGRRTILKHVSFRVDPGERLALFGPNGAGKSSLLRLVLRFADPERGRVLLDGSDIKAYTLSSVRGQMSVVFQESLFFGLSVRENIALGRPSASNEEIQAAAQQAMVADMIEKLPQGYETPIVRQGGVLSGGEKQRIAIARALLRNGPVWLLDEPTSALDAGASQAIIQLIQEVTRGRTTIWVTHDPRILPFVDRVLALKKGRVEFSGRPREFKNWLDRGGFKAPRGRGEKGAGIPQERS